MRPPPEVHDALAGLLSYPGGEAGSRWRAAAAVVQRGVPAAAPALERFVTAVEGLSQGELEEQYTRTFDNVAERSLEIGWQLFGEQYARGVLLVRLRALLRDHGVPERTELPDHLTHVLPLLGRAPEGLAAAMARGQVLPAAEKVLEALRAIDSPWTGVLEATAAVLGMHEPAPTERAREVLR